VENVNEGFKKRERLTAFIMWENTENGGKNVDRRGNTNDGG